MTPDQMKQMAQEAAALEEYWALMVPCAPPPRYIIAGWLRRFAYETVEAGIDAYNVLCSKGKHKPSTEAGIKYASGAMWKIQRGDTFAQTQTFGDGTPLPPDWDQLDGDAKRQHIAAHRGKLQ